MTSRVSHTTIDCRDAFALSEWWKGVLAYTDVPGDPNEPGHEECMIVDPLTGHRLLFIEVPDEQLPGKRIHLDVRADGPSARGRGRTPRRARRIRRRRPPPA